MSVRHIPCSLFSEGIRHPLTEEVLGLRIYLYFPYEIINLLWLYPWSCMHSSAEGLHLTCFFDSHECHAVALSMKCCLDTCLIYLCYNQSVCLRNQTASKGSETLAFPSQ